MNRAPEQIVFVACSTEASLKLLRFFPLFVVELVQKTWKSVHSFSLMKFSTPLVRGILIRRSSRFTVEVNLEDGRKVSAHCANTAKMDRLKDAGS